MIHVHEGLQKRSVVRDATIEMMAKTARATVVVAALVTVVLVSGCCAFAVGDDDAESMFADDPTVEEQLTARSPSMSDMTVEAYSTEDSGRPSVNRPPTTNIQKVFRSAKALDAMSAMMALMTSTDNDTVANGQGEDVGTYPSDLEWLLNVYNPHRWNPVMLPAASKLSVQCRDVMKVYLEALRRGSFWAAKSECSSVYLDLNPKEG